MWSMMRLCLIALLFCGCYMSHARGEGLGECGNGVVEAGEECDGGEGVCTGIDECEGFARCREDCTFGDCVSVGFGTLSGPVTLGGGLQAVIRNRAVWTGARHGVFYTGTRAEPPMTVDAWFAGVDGNGAVDVEPHEVFPLPENNGEIDACWRDDSHFGIGATISWGETPIILNITDEEGWLLIDPGVAVTWDESTDVAIAAGSGGYGIVWKDVGRQRVVFAAATPDIGIVSPVMIDELSPYPMHRLPHIVTFDTGFAIAWQVDGPSTGESYVSFARLDNDSDLIGGMKSLFADLRPQPPQDLVYSGDVFALVFATQPYFDSPVLDLHLATFDEEGVEVVAPADAGRVVRAESRDAGLAWTGSEYGVARASPRTEEPDAIRELAFRRFGPDGRQIGAELVVSFLDADVSKPSVDWDGLGYGVSFAVDRAGILDVEFVRLGCIPPD